MNAIEFPEQTRVIAKDQPEYIPLPVHITPDGVVTSCWQPTPEERHAIAGGCQIYLSQLTFGQPLQPVVMQTEFNPPLCEAKEPAAERRVSFDPLPPADDTEKTSQPHGKLTHLALMKGLSKPFLFAVDMQTLSGKAVCHFVRVETQTFDADDTFRATKFNKLSPDADPRLQVMAEIFSGGAVNAMINLLKLLSLCMSLMDGFKLLPAMPHRLREALNSTYAAAEAAIKSYG